METILVTSGIAQFMPVFVFGLIALVVGAILFKNELLGKSGWIVMFVALLLAVIFGSFGSLIEFVVILVGWFIVIFMALFFLMFFVAFIGKDADFMKKGISVAAVISLIVVFVGGIVYVFGGDIFPYLPGLGFGSSGNPEGLLILSWLYSPNISGTFWIIIAAIVVGVILVKTSVVKKD